MLILARIKTDLRISLSHEDKKFIKNKAEELGYPTVSSFLIDSAKDFFIVRMDLSDYREIAKEINYIGKNINSLVRRINTDGFYTDNDLDFIDVNQKKIIELMTKEYKRLLKEKDKYLFGNISKKKRQELVDAFNKEKMEIPKSFLLEEVYQMIRKTVGYLCRIIESSPLKDDGLDEYLWDYVNKGKTLGELTDERLIKFSNDLFFYTKKIERKMDVLENEFDDDDWDELKVILDEYEIY